MICVLNSIRLSFDCRMKNILITGATGLVATELAIHLLHDTNANLLLVSNHIDELQCREYAQNARAACVVLEDLEKFVKEHNISIDICIHTAFARSGNGNLIVSSIDYLQKVLSVVKSLHIHTFVNISSQSVYGKITPPLWTEDSPLDPDYLYAMGKFASERVTELMLRDSDVRWTNIRLCSVCENARFVKVFVQNALDGKEIHLTAPDQGCSFIDVRDVADALTAFVKQESDVRLEAVYNLGANQQYTVEEIAQMVKSIGESRYCASPVSISKETSDNHTRIGMDSSKFMTVFGWHPKYSMRDMIISMFEMLKNPNGGGIR